MRLLVAGKLALVSLAFYLAWRLGSRIGWPDLFARIRSADPGTVWLAALCLVARFASAQERWQQALARIGNPGQRIRRFFALMASILVNHLTPGARLLGGLFRARFVSQTSNSTFAPTYGTVLADIVSNQTTQISLTWLALAAIAWKLEMHTIAVLTGLSLGLVISLLALWARSRRKRSSGSRLDRWLERRSALPSRFVSSRLASGSREALTTLRLILSDRTVQVRMALCGGGIFVFNALAQWLVFKGMNVEVGLVAVGATVALGLGAGLLTGTPGGIGTTEAAMIATFVALGVNEIEATAATAIYRGLHYTVVIGLGVPSLLYAELGPTHTRIHPESPVSG